MVSIAILSAGALNGQTIGNWQTAGGAATTNANNAVGINVGTPDGWQEIKYCPLNGNDEKGFVVTREVCMPPPPNTTGLGPVDNYYGVLVDPPMTGGTNEPNITFGTGTVSTLGPIPFVYYRSTTTPKLGLRNGQEPLMLARTVEFPNGQSGPAGAGSYKSRFTVMPDGNSGFNTESPRAALDVQNANVANKPIAMFGNLVPYTVNPTAGQVTPVGGSAPIQQMFTRGFSMVPMLSSKGFNGISQLSDMGFFFSNGKGTDGTNTDGALVIAPFTTDNTVGGMRMEANGNTEFRGNLRCTKAVVNAQWWPDNVFRPTYELMSLTDVAAYISHNGHLPGVPSEQEVVSQGQDIGALQQIQQTKIEELTLYAIDQQATINAQNIALEEAKTKLANQELRLQKLEALLNQKN